MRTQDEIDRELDDLRKLTPPDYSSGTWVPAFTNLTVVNGTGGATYAGQWVLVGKMLSWWIQITITGTCTTASAVGSTSCDMPFAAAHQSPFVVSNHGVATVGTGVVSSANCITPTWSAYNGNVYLSGTYLIN